MKLTSFRELLAQSAPFSSLVFYLTSFNSDEKTVILKCRNTDHDVFHGNIEPDIQPLVIVPKQNNNALSNSSQKQENPISNIIDWIDCTDYQELPLGIWLACIDNERKPYVVIDVGENNQGHKIITSGGSFHWDMKPIKAYTDFIKYTHQESRGK